jgi:hypothetical protein
MDGHVVSSTASAPIDPDDRGRANIACGPGTVPISEHATSKQSDMKCCSTGRERSRLQPARFLLTSNDSVQLHATMPRRDPLVSAHSRLDPEGSRVPEA